jgi:RNA polymerase sigma-70 factor (ECF subfamily)
VTVGHDDRRSRLEALFAAHGAAVLGYARRRSDAATAEDVLAEVFVVAWRRLDRMPDDALPWLLSCARRVLANQRRGERRQLALVKRLAAVSPRPAIEFAFSSGTGRLADALASLSDLDREVLLLVAWEDLSVDRAAAVFGCSPNAFSTRLRRARKRLVAALSAPDSADNATPTAVARD